LERLDGSRVPCPFSPAQHRSSRELEVAEAGVEKAGKLMLSARLEVPIHCKGGKVAEPRWPTVAPEMSVTALKESWQRALDT
jgi:hypothetical protein